MCDLMVRGARFYEIKDGLVLSHSIAGSDTFCWTIADFRRLCMEGPRIIEEFDAQSSVLMFQREH